MQLQNTIDISELPAAFRDAIRIARHLEVKFLWIGSLCINQDQKDRSDWEAESRLMNEVYSNAFLNVSATMSVHGTDSLFEERNWDNLLPSEIDLEIDGFLTKCFIVDSGLWLDEIANAPLNQRGWVFQERFLARRVVHFGRRQMGWE